MNENRNREGLKNCTSLKVDMSTIPLIKVSSYVGKDTSNQSVEDLRYSYTISSFTFYHCEQIPSPGDCHVVIIIVFLNFAVHMASLKNLKLNEA